MRIGSPAGLFRTQLCQNPFSQSLKALRIAKETGHVDENVIRQRLRLLRVLPQDLRILIQRRDLLQRHPSRDAPADSGLLIQAEIDADGGPKDQADLVQFAPFGHFPRLRQVGMAADARQFGGDALGRQNEIDGTSRDRAHRHGGPLSRFRILRESHASGRLDRLQPIRAVRSRAGEDHANGRIALFLRQSYGEIVNRVLRPGGVRCEAPAAGFPCGWSCSLLGGMT